MWLPYLANFCACAVDRAGRVNNGAKAAIDLKREVEFLTVPLVYWSFNNISISKIGKTIPGHAMFDDAYPTQCRKSMT